MNNPDPLEMQGQIDAMRVAMGRLIESLPTDQRLRYAKGLLVDGEEFQTQRVPQMAHPTYMTAFDALLHELA